MDRGATLCDFERLQKVLEAGWEMIYGFISIRFVCSISDAIPWWW